LEKKGREQHMEDKSFFEKGRRKILEGKPLPLGGVGLKGREGKGTVGAFSETGIDSEKFW